MVKRDMGWAIRGLLVSLVVLMITLLVLSVPLIISPDFQVLGTTLILVIGVNLIFAMIALFRFDKR
jgi:hypothetical protein